MIRQGEVYWVSLDETHESEGDGQYPCVVVQNNLFNRSRIHSVVVCALTFNLQRGAAPGNVLLSPKEANLPEPSAVNIAQIFTVDKRQLGYKICALSPKRLGEILEGIDLLLQPRDLE